MQKKAELKGISMPIKIIVIIAIAVLVWVVIAVFSIEGYPPGEMSDNAAWAEGCNRWIATGCTDITSEMIIENYDWDNDGAPDTFRTACEKANKLDSNGDCNLILCGCPSSSYAS